MLNAVAETPSEIRWTEGRTTIDWGYGDPSTFEHDGETYSRPFKNIQKPIIKEILLNRITKEILLNLIIKKKSYCTSHVCNPIETNYKGVPIETNCKGNPIATNYKGNPVETNYDEILLKQIIKEILLK